MHRLGIFSYLLINVSLCWKAALFSGPDHRLYRWRCVPLWFLDSQFTLMHHWTPWGKADCFCLNFIASLSQFALLLFFPPVWPSWDWPAVAHSHHSRKWDEQNTLYPTGERCRAGRFTFFFFLFFFFFYKWYQIRDWKSFSCEITRHPGPSCIRSLKGSYRDVYEEVIVGEVRGEVCGGKQMIFGSACVPCLRFFCSSLVAEDVLVVADAVHKDGYLPFSFLLFRR